MTELINAGELRERYTHVCCISLTDQVFPLCSVNVFTETGTLSQRTVVPELSVPMPYTKPLSMQEWMVNVIRRTQSVMTKES